MVFLDVSSVFSLLLLLDRSLHIAGRVVKGKDAAVMLQEDASPQWVGKASRLRLRVCSLQLLRGVTLA